MKVGNLVQRCWSSKPYMIGIIVDRVAGLKDQATVQIMWADMQTSWECPLDVDEVTDNEGR